MLGRPRADYAVRRVTFKAGGRAAMVGDGGQSSRFEDFAGNTRGEIVATMRQRRVIFDGNAGAVRSAAIDDRAAKGPAGKTRLGTFDGHGREYPGFDEPFPETPVSSRDSSFLPDRFS